MIKTFLEKSGIYLSRTQERLVKIAFATVLISLLYIPPTIFSPPPPFSTDPYKKAEGLDIFSGKYFNSIEFFFEMIRDPQERKYQGLANPYQIGLLIYTGLTTLSLFVSSVLFMVMLLHYSLKLAFNKNFREAEISKSVNYIERDEREQFQTMLATRRAYMVVNFVLLIGWLLNLLTGNFSFAFWLFFIQIIGVVSFRQQIEPIKK